MTQTVKSDGKLNKKPDKGLIAVGIILMVFGFMFFGFFSVSAAEEKGSVELRCVYSEGNNERILANDEYSIVKIAGYGQTAAGVTFTVTDAFKDFDCDWAALPASGLNKKAGELADFCGRNNLYTENKAADEAGVVKFEGLESGLYLINRTKVFEANTGFVYDPQLYFIPQSIGDEVIFDIKAAPKYSYSDSGTPDTPAPDKPTPDKGRTPTGGVLPYTGQLLWPVTVFAILGCVLIFFGYILLKKEGPGEKKSR